MDIKQDENSKLQHMDLFLKTRLVDFWFSTAEHLQNGEYRKAFKGYEIMFYMVIGYDFNNKIAIQEHIDTTNEYLNSLGGKPLDLRAEISLYGRTLEFRELVNRLVGLMGRAFTDLNLWFKNVETSDDLDVRISKENFGDELSLLQKKKEKLLKLDKVEILKLFTKNSLHDAYAKGLINGVVENVL